MRSLHWLCVVFVVSVSTVSLAGDIQVSCEPNLRIYLDGKLLGVSIEKEDGLFLRDVRNGTHTIRVERDGFLPQSIEVDVADAPIEVKVEKLLPDLMPKPESTPEVTPIKRQVGTLLITSAPQNCTVEIDGKAEAKAIPELLIDGLAVGEHWVTFSKEGYQPISGTVRLHPGGEVGVRGDLIAGKVETYYVGKGSLRIISVPEACTVHILGMVKEKTGGYLNLSFLPAGEHRLVVTWKSHELSTNVVITNGNRTIVRVSFAKDAVPFSFSYEPE